MSPHCRRIWQRSRIGWCTPAGCPTSSAPFAGTDRRSAPAGRALRAGACVLADCEMVADGVIRTRLPAANTVLCSLNDPRTREIQQRERTTRSAAAVELWRDHLPGSVIAIGNAPTALFRLLETLTDAPELRPAAILAFPVGFVGAAESKLALVEAGLDIPFVTLLGRRGGSAMAAAAVNALSGPLTR